MVRDPPQFPPGPAQIAARSYAFDDGPRYEPESRTDQQRPGPRHPRGVSVEGDAKTRKARKQRATEVHRHPRQRMCRAAGRRVGRALRNGTRRKIQLIPGGYQPGAVVPCTP
jgi:hypothetical protein